VHRRAIIGVDALGALLERLRDELGYRLVGPVLRDGAIVYAEIDGIDDLPAGWMDVQEPGRYRLERRNDAALFGHAVGQHSWKDFLHVPVQRLWRAERTGDGFKVIPEVTEAPKWAFIGVRSCDLHAIEIQDRVLLKGAHVDPHYAARREDNFVVAVNCAYAAGTCFCASMGTGPRAKSGFDLALTELIDDKGHRFLVETGTEAGVAVLAGVPQQEASDGDVGRAEAVTARTAASQQRQMPADVRSLLLHNLEHPRWDDVAERCLTCGNCTLVCPTCFCTTTEEETHLEGETAGRRRRWDSCFTMEFSYLHGGSVRRSSRSRYRQWMTHKLATWHDQFGSSGCVGCGRCISWCPVGIDITEEAGAIVESQSEGAGHG
jgi:sulfhydrogenase subunit beta (sulfur reductase)